MACPKPECTADPCCRIEHHGALIRSHQCPRCGLRKLPGVMSDLFDCSLAAGIVCGRCGHYWEPRGLPIGVRAEARRAAEMFGERGWAARRKAATGG